MIKCYLEDKTLLVQFTTTELDHHVATYIKENVDDIIMRKKCAWKCICNKYESKSGKSF